MSGPQPHEDVLDPTADPRHKPPAAAPGDDPDVPKPRDVDPAAPPPPDEPVTTPTDAPVKPAGRQP